MPSSADIRKQFIEYFLSKDHVIVPSAPLIPADDPTLLFINAGMNQFKNIFLGKSSAPNPRVVNTQKCIRAGGKHNDLEEVGRDSYHHTFFEMLGNWSFGDYYKKEAITWAWELFTKVWKLDPSLLFATVHHDDEEAAGLWREVTDIDPTHIEFHGDKDNFWEMGETGPCGPCSEIHIDRGVEFCDKQDDPNHKCRVNGDCHRFIELWNLVFIQYNRTESGDLEPLSNRYVDTGAGFERVCQVLQKVKSNYDTDLFTPIIDAIAGITGIPYQKKAGGVSHRVIADHVRALTFAIADGGMPSNEGRGYVLRRILRRAARHGRLLNQRQAFLYKLVDVVVDVMGHHFTEISDRRSHVAMIIKSEEERFNQTLDTGLARFAEVTAGLSEGETIPGNEVFMLYDTYGFPVDLTRILAEEKGLAIDESGFEKEMQQQRERARAAGSFRMKNEEIEWTRFRDDGPTRFVGYSGEIADARIIRFAHTGEDVRLVLDVTPFYAESGGQVADRGRIFGEGFEIEVTDVRKQDDLFVHHGRMISGEIRDIPVRATIESEIRLRTARNHTATHLLHTVLRGVLGAHVQQKGSLVNPDYLRFDFTHIKQTEPRELQIIEKRVNALIRACLPVKTDMMSLEEARKTGAMALFGEKYGQEVRVVRIENKSMELCGGTHVRCTGEIGFFRIVSESSVAAGVRRIEALTGDAAWESVQRDRAALEEMAVRLNSPVEQLPQRVERLLSDQKELEREIDSFKARMAGNTIDVLAASAQKVEDVVLVAARVEAAEANDLRTMGDRLRERLPDGIGVLAADTGGKVSILTIVPKSMTRRIRAGDLVKELAPIVGGRGGGRPDMAMAGGKDTEAIDEMLRQAPEILERLLKKGK